MGKAVCEEDDISSFFFTEFPEQLNAKEMFEIFKGYGLVVEGISP